MTTDKRRRYSAPVVDGINKSASRAMLRAVGFQDEDFRKPQIGIASTWSNLTPCHMHIDGLARHASTCADPAGCKSLIFNTLTLSDGISNGPRGSKD
ncbi:MAG: dihydroxy-acid dehydratase, partial [Alteromonadaceae bacterium]|nr:dihydroxy-acid dehydratase [Alteromonadaceae bacterium]